jgi:hypothetical protein
VIPFDVTDADIYADIIALCPIPQLLDFTLETPGGKVIKPAGSGPNVKYFVRPQVAFYRVTLPALAADPAGSHAGKWKAILALKDRSQIDKLLRNREVAAALANNPVGESLPYSLVAHAYSNLQFDASLQQDSLAPGATATLRASLKQYDIPFTGAADVWAEITAPDLSTMNLTLNRVADAVYSASFSASLPGVYLCRVRAAGYFNSKDKFTREKTLTAATYYGNYSTTPPHDTLCEVLHCLTSDNVLTKGAIERLRQFGINAEAFRKCLEAHCPEPRERVRPKPAKRSDQKPGLNLKQEKPAKPIKLPKVKPPKPAPPAQGPKIIHMFSEPEMPMSRKSAAPAAGAATFPRIVKMFSLPEEEGEAPKPPAAKKRNRKR